MILCGANSYEQKYYLAPEFEALPAQIKDELQIMCVLYTEEIGGLFIVEFDEDGRLLLKTSSEDDDFFYDEIGSELKIKELMNEKQELFASLELYYRIFIKAEKPEE